MRDRNVLLLLFTGQLALIPYGYAIEAEFERNNSTLWSLGMTALFVPAWVVHVLLWLTLARMSQHNISAALPCNGWRDAGARDQEEFRFIFDILLYSEIALFSLFGLVFPIVWLRWRRQQGGARSGFGVVLVAERGFVQCAECVFQGAAVCAVHFDCDEPAPGARAAVSMLRCANSWPKFWHAAPRRQMSLPPAHRVKPWLKFLHAVTLNLAMPGQHHSVANELHLRYPIMTVST